MSLVLSGFCLDTTSEIVQGPSGPFESTTFTVLVGEGADSRVEQVRAGRDFKRSDWPTKGEDVALAVVVAPFATRAGAGYRLTALTRVREPETASA